MMKYEQMMKSFTLTHVLKSDSKRGFDEIWSEYKWVLKITNPTKNWLNKKQTKNNCCLFKTPDFWLQRIWEQNKYFHSSWCKICFLSSHVQALLASLQISCFSINLCFFLSPNVIVYICSVSFVEEIKKKTLGTKSWNTF